MTGLTKTLVVGALTFVAGRSHRLRRFLPALPLAVAAYEFWQSRKHARGEPA